MNIGRAQSWCKACVKLTPHVYGTSMMGKVWKECLECGHTAKVLYGRS